MKTSDLLLGVLVATIWGSNFSVIEVGLRNLDPLLLTALRFTFSAVPLIFFLRWPSGVRPAAVAGYGLIFGVGLWWVVNLALSRGLSPGLSSLLLQFSAYFTILFSALIFRERINVFQIAGMVFSALGLLAIIHFTRGSSTVEGMALVLLAAFAWSICNLIVKQCRPENMMAFIAWSSAFAAPALFGLTYLSEGATPFRQLAHNLNGAAIFSVFFQAYVTTVFGYMVWNNLMKKYPAATVAPLSLLVPISGILTSYLVFDEHLSNGMWVAMLVVLGGIGLFVSSQRITGKRRTAPETSPLK